MMFTFVLGDDSIPIRKALKNLLEFQDGWTVVGEADNGKDAIEKVQKLKPDVVILDVSMPVMDGLQAAKHLRETSPDTFLVMFSNYADTQLKHVALSAGVDAVVPKSEPVVLLNRLHELLRPWRNRNVAT